jgi:PAS domain S-box-containing protein
MSDFVKNSRQTVSPASTTPTRFEVALRRLADCGRVHGGNFFDDMVRAISEATCAKIAFIGELIGDHSIRGISFLIDGKPGPDITYPLAGTPCENVIKKGTCFHRSDVQRRYPSDKFLTELGLDSYLGTALRGSDGRVTGLISILHDKPLDTALQPEFLVELFAGRVGAELERQRAETALRQNEERFGLFMRHVPGAAWMKDLDGRYVYVNQEAEQVFGKSREQIVGFTDDEIFPPQIAKQFKENDRRAVVEGNRLQTIEMLPQEDGLHYSVVSKFPISNDGGKPSMVGGIAIDITERRTAEQALLLAEHRFRLALRSEALTVYEQDEQLRYRWIYPEAPDVIGKTDHDLVNTEDAQQLHAAKSDVLRTGKSTRLEVRVRRGDRDKYYDLIIDPHRDADGNINGVGGASLDITERKLAELALKQSEARYRGIGETINYGVWVCDPQGRNTYASPSFLNLVGLTQQQCSDVGWKDVLHPDEITSTIAAWKDCAATGSFWERTHRFRGVDGQWHYVLARGIPIRDEAGRIQCWAGINLDVDNLKHAEEALRISEERFRIATDAGRVGTWEWDILSGRVIWSDLVYELHGMKPGEFGGTLQDFEKLIHPDERYRVSDAISNALQHSAEYAIEFQALGPQGQYRWFWAKARILRNERGEPMRLIGATMDVTDRKRAEDALRHQARQLADIDRRKDEFIAMLAHELRNPLGPIRNGVHLLRNPKLDAAGADRVREMIDRQTTHMSRIVDDLLDVSRITRGKIVLKKETMDLVQMVRDVSGDYKHDLDRANVALNLQLPADPVWIFGDRTRLAQALSNLLHNAAKFSKPHGCVTVRLTPQKSYAELVVTDDGAGIEPAVLPGLFEPFAQGSQSIDRSRGGLGLGLALVKGLIDLHEGAVHATSSGIGKGAEFTIRLPMVADGANPENDSDAASTSTALQILVVEDNPDAAESLQMLLTISGHHVKMAASGTAAITITRDWTPAVVICDIGLPEMDGYAVCKILREMPHLHRTRFIALTGYGQDDDQRRARAAGFHLHITKPVDPDKLERLISDLA